MDKPKTITEVCKMLGLTSRTVRYYEQFGLIQTIRESRTAPRRLDSENIERLRKIRFLRKLGFALEDIANVIDSDEKASALIASKTTEFKGEANALLEHIRLLERVLAAVENGENIYQAEETIRQPENCEKSFRIASEVIMLMVEHRFEELFAYIIGDLRKMPPAAMASLWTNFTAPLGKFVSISEQYMDDGTTFNRVHFEKMDILVMMDICDNKVVSLFLKYYKEPSHRKEQDTHV